MIRRHELWCQLPLSDCSDVSHTVQQRATTSISCCSLYKKNRIPSLYFNEVIHVSLPRTPSSTEEYDGQEGDVFYFKDGCVVFWDIPQPQVVALLAELASFEVSPYDRRTVVENYSEEMSFHYGKHAGLMPTGELVLSIGQQNWAKTQVLEKIAFSYGVQRSVKMAVIESIADDLIVSLKHIPDILMDKRALKMDQKGVMKKMGQLLAVRGLINLHLPLSETPEAYWEEPWLEELYSKISRELDLANRIRSLNRRLDYAHQVVEVLRTDLSEKHSTRLEQIIIGLISIEVLFEMVHFFI
uniref:DUF155 domain-containing protein n=1 Tax=Cryptomonas curvata TaxID=233186 RepID=A0A7S0QLH5_9CRYP|mmetsp:Transcript_33857/g.71020  ORF Transcript_33857/g.71020 Transcript_33857/m.71020 type:complete len:299 (+) Transcript_33857:494-1390(+)